MKISTERPPVWDSVAAAFKINPINAVFTYGDTIYNPGKGAMPDHLIAHEEVHEAQQAETTPELWWGKYLRDPQFRIDQEAPAYGKQYEMVCHQTHDRNLRAKYLHLFACSLSGPLYDHCVDYQRAAQMIKNYSNI